MEWSSATGNPAVYWFFYVILFLSLIICGYGIGLQQPAKYKRFAWSAIIIYALIEGLRWLRGADYYGYYYLFENGYPQSYEKQLEPLFNIFSKIIYYLHLPPSIGFIILSGFLLGGMVLVCYRYKKAAIFCLPIMFVLFGSSSAENLVRQYAATTFCMLAYYFYSIDNKKHMYLSLLCIPLVHFSGLFCVLLFLIFTWKKIPFKSPLLLSALYTFLFFFWNPEWLEGFASIISMYSGLFGSLSQAESYMANASEYLTLEGSQSFIDGVEVVTSTVLKYVTYFSNLCVVYFGFKACKEDNKLHVAYYFSFLGIIIMTMAGDIMILSRFGLWVNWMIPFVVGLIFCNIDFRNKPYLKGGLLFVFFMRFVFYGVIRALGSLPYAGCGFIWDK